MSEQLVKFRKEDSGGSKFADFVNLRILDCGVGFKKKVFNNADFRAAFRNVPKNVSDFYLRLQPRPDYK